MDNQQSQKPRYTKIKISDKKLENGEFKFSCTDWSLTSFHDNTEELVHISKVKNTFLLTAVLSFLTAFLALFEKVVELILTLYLG